jgi:putative ABC transport system permease protein
MRIREIKNKIIDKIRSRRNEGVRMKYSVIMLISYRNIAANKIRSFLTIGGVAIGIAIITFLISIGFGIQKMVINEITKSNPINIIDVSGENLENLVVLDDDTTEKIKNIEGVSHVERLVNLGGKFYNADSKVDSVLYGASKEYMDLARAKLAYGTFDYLNDEANIMVTSKLAVLLGFQNPADAVGKEIEYEIIISKEIIDKNIKNERQGRQKIKITGIINDETGKNDSIFACIPFKNLKKDFGVIAGQSGKIEIKNDANLESIRSKIEQTGLTTESVNDTIKDINSFFNIVSIVMIIFGVIIMSISAMGMLNTLSVSLLQRTREVGILKALGAKRDDVFKMFILEAAIISFSGGIIGLFAGFGLAKFVNWFFNFLAEKKGVAASYFIDMPYYFVIALAVFIAILGLVTGIMPARRASKTHALDALRYE